MRFPFPKFAAFAAALLGLAGAGAFPAGGGEGAQAAFVADSSPAGGGEASPPASGGLSDAGAAPRAELRAARFGGTGHSSSGSPAAREADPATPAAPAVRRAPSAPCARAGRDTHYAHPAQAP
jgi:hypothetical protein